MVRRQCNKRNRANKSVAIAACGPFAQKIDFSSLGRGRGSIFKFYWQGSNVISKPDPQTTRPPITTIIKYQSSFQNDTSFLSLFFSSSSFPRKSKRHIRSRCLRGLTISTFPTADRYIRNLAGALCYYRTTHNHTF